MLDSETKKRIDNARNMLVGVIPNPQSQVEQITIALIYKFMDDMDAEAEDLGGTRSFFTGNYAKFAWSKLMRTGLAGQELLTLYSDAISSMPENPGIPQLFRDIFINAYLPYRSPDTLRGFLKIINEFSYDHSERLGDAFEYLLSILGSQGDAGMFRTPRNIIDFMVEIMKPKIGETILDPACGTAGFLISSYKYILKCNTDKNGNSKLTPSQKEILANSISGYDISPDMVMLSRANMYLHGFNSPLIHNYDTLTLDDRWNEFADVILANPPFMSPKGGIKPHKRFSIQAKRSEVLFVDYMVEHLTPNGRAAIIIPEGIIFQSQTAYKQLRKMLVENSLVAVISLPAGVFNPYAGIKTSILILDKSIAKTADSIAFFKVENDGFGLGAQRRAIEKNDLPQVQAELMLYLQAIREGANIATLELACGQIVQKAKIATNGDYNLSGERYKEGAAQSQTYPSYALSEMCDIFNGSTPSKQENRFWENGTVPWFTVEDIRKGGRIIEKTEKFVTKAGLNETSLKLLPRHSVLLCCTASIGEYAFTEIEVATNQQFNGLVVNSAFAERLLPKYLFFISSRFKDELIRLSGKTSFNFVSVGTLKTIQIPLPPLDVQKEIVAEIEGYQKVINGARAVLDNYRPHIDVRPDWTTVKLADVCESISDGDHQAPPKSPQGVPFVTIGNINDDHQLDFTKTFYVPESYYSSLSSTRTPQGGDILYTVTGSYGIPVLVPENTKFCFQRHIALIRTGSQLLNRFLLALLATPLLLNQGHKAARGVAQKTVSLGSLREFQIPLPPIEIQQAIVAEIEAEQALVAANKELITRFEQKIQATLDQVWGKDLSLGESVEGRT